MIPHPVTANLDPLINEIQLELPEAPYNAMIHHLRRSIIEFFEISNSWVEEVGPIWAVEDIDTYDLLAVTGLKINSVIRVHTIIANRQVELERTKDNGVRFRYWQGSPSQISIAPMDELKNRNVYISASLSPVIDKNGKIQVSEYLFRDFHDAFIAGAKARLYKIPRKDWTDPNLYAENRRIFDYEAKEALRFRARGYSRLPDRAPVKKKRPFH